VKCGGGLSRASGRAAMAIALTATARASPMARKARMRVMASEPVGQDATAAAPWSDRVIRALEVEEVAEG
jgi:hypothetical protein